MSSETDLRRRSQSFGRNNTRRPPLPSSPSFRRRTPPTTPRKLSALSEPFGILHKCSPFGILHKCSSEPALPGTSNGAGDNFRSLDSGGWLYRPMTCTDVLSPSPSLSPDRLLSPHKVYQEDNKVVVTVTVEGSTGPVRTMVKLGSSVDETIKLVIQQYSKEGRIPSLDKDAASQYDLHLSYFSFESLERSDAIGSLGSRNFYLRKCTTIDKPISDIASEITCAESNAPHEPCPLMVFLPGYISRKLAKLMRRMRKLWKMLGCLHDS